MVRLTSFLDSENLLRLMALSSPLPLLTGKDQNFYNDCSSVGASRLRRATLYRTSAMRATEPRYCVSARTGDDRWRGTRHGHRHQ